MYGTDFVNLRTITDRQIHVAKFIVLNVRTLERSFPQKGEGDGAT